MHLPVLEECYQITYTQNQKTVHVYMVARLIRFLHTINRVICNYKTPLCILHREFVLQGHIACKMHVLLL